MVGDRDIEFSDIPNLKYVEAVINETLRILPTIPMVGRRCDEDINLGKITKNPEVYFKLNNAAPLLFDFKIKSYIGNPDYD